MADKSGKKGKSSGSPTEKKEPKKEPEKKEKKVSDEDKKGGGGGGGGGGGKRRKKDKDKDKDDDKKGQKGHPSGLSFWQFRTFFSCCPCDVVGKSQDDPNANQDEINSISDTDGPDEAGDYQYESRNRKQYGYESESMNDCNNRYQSRRPGPGNCTECDTYDERGPIHGKKKAFGCEKPMPCGQNLRSPRSYGRRQRRGRRGGGYYGDGGQESWGESEGFDDDDDDNYSYRDDDNDENYDEEMEYRIGCRPKPGKNNFKCKYCRPKPSRRCHGSRYGSRQSSGQGSRDGSRGCSKDGSRDESRDEYGGGRSGSGGPDRYKNNGRKNCKTNCCPPVKLHYKCGTCMDKFASGCRQYIKICRPACGCPPAKKDKAANDCDNKKKQSGFKASRRYEARHGYRNKRRRRDDRFRGRRNNYDYDYEDNYAENEYQPYYQPYEDNIYNYQYNMRRYGPDGYQKRGYMDMDDGPRGRDMGYDDRYECGGGGGGGGGYSPYDMQGDKYY